MKLLRIKGTKFNSLRQLVLTLMGSKAAYTAEQYGPHGIDSRPPNGMTAIYAQTGADGDAVVIAYLNKNLLTEIGETRLFSTDADLANKFNVWLRSDGTVLIGTKATPADYTNFAVKYNQLETEFNKLKEDHNDLVSKYNAHTHATSCGAGAGTASATTSTDSPNSSDITAAKNSKIKFCD